MPTSDDITPEMLARLKQLQRDHTKALKKLANMEPDPTAREWLVTLPLYDEDGIIIDRFTITEQEAHVDKMRAAFNPQRDNRSVDAGTYTRLTVDGQVWMTDTPAEVRDHVIIEDALIDAERLLVVGLGMGMVVHRALTAFDLTLIDIVEIDARVIKAVGPHYEAMAAERGVDLRIFHSDIHDWHIPRGAYWDAAWFDIWPTINDDDMPEVARLRKRFRQRVAWQGAWAQNERIAMKRRIRTGKWAY